MKKLLLIFCIISINIFLLSKDFLIVDSDKRKLTEDELQEKTLSFLTYSRNEIFARHGYIFKNGDLSYFFNHMDWYKKSSNDFNLNNEEIYNVNLIKKIEEDRKINSPKFPKGIVTKYNFNNKPLFYIGEMGHNEDYYKVGYYENGKFILLGSDYYWTLSCKSIPVEYLELNNIGTIPKIADQCVTIEDQTRIKIYDIDFNYNNDTSLNPKKELVIQEMPESGSGNGTVNIAGDDINGNFQLLFKRSGVLKNIFPVGNNKIQIEIFRKAGYVTSSKIIYRYIINRENNKITKIPFNYENVIYQHNVPNKYKCNKLIPIYVDAISAMNKNPNMIIGFTSKDETYRIDVFYYLPEIEELKKFNENLKSLSFEGINIDIQGWVNRDDFEGNFSYFQAGG